RGQHFGNQDHSILLRRSDLWHDVKNRVIRKPSSTSVASNSTTGQGLINPPEEHVCCAYGDWRFAAGHVVRVHGYGG
nr:hypothetical protein [Tanacetum cinerariifolium]